MKSLLVVDDDSITRKVLTHMLSKGLEDYQIEQAGSGEEAIEKAKSLLPELILLDVQMPGMTGYEVCRFFKENDDFKKIPIIFLTGQADAEDVVKGFSVGAVDYLQKPVNNQELLVRVRTQIDLVESHRQLESYAKDMELQVKERTKQLMHAERMSSLGVMAAGVAHEINNPTSFISGNIQTFEKFWPYVEECLNKEISSLGDDADKLKFILNQVPKMMQGMKNGVSNISNIVRSLKSYSRQDDIIFEKCDLHECIEQALILCKNHIKHNVELQKKLSEHLPKIEGDPQKLVQVIVNLVSNAKDAIGEKKGYILIATDVGDSFVNVKIEDNGPGFKMTDISSIWQPFFTTKGREKGTGLGLSITHGIIEEHQGSINAENRDEGGARFSIKLPINRKVEAKG